MRRQWLLFMDLIERKNRGQSMVEYVLIISLIALAVIIAVTNFGDALLGLYTNIKDTLLGL